MLNKTLKSRNVISLKRKLRIRSKIFGTSTKPRVTIFRSNKYFYAQAIDDVNGCTLVNVDGKKLGLTCNKNNMPALASEFSKKLKSINISSIVFDRNGYLYHGVVASFADSLRDNDIRF